jgi:single-stranded DNA-binding protein
MKRSVRVHLNRSTVIGRVTSAGCKLRYDERSNPTCSFWLDVEEAGKTGQTHHSYIPVEIIGKYAESAAESLESGQECLVEGRLQYRKSVGKDGQQKAGLVVVSWCVTIGTLPQEPRSNDAAPQGPTEASSTRPEPKGRPRYQRWKPPAASIN